MLTLGRLSSTQSLGKCTEKEDEIHVTIELIDSIPVWVRDSTPIQVWISPTSPIVRGLCSIFTVCNTCKL